MPKDEFRREVASRLKEARRERTLTQRQLADLGLSTQQNISRYEKGFIPDSWFLLARLHAEKAIDLNWLLGASASAREQAVPPAGGSPAAGSVAAVAAVAMALSGRTEASPAATGDGGPSAASGATSVEAPGPVSRSAGRPGQDGKLEPDTP